MDNKRFGKKLKKLRRERNLTQVELSEKIGIVPTYISKIENFKIGSPSKKIVKKMAKVLNYNEDELMLLTGIIPKDIKEKITNDLITGLELLEIIRNF